MRICRKKQRKYSKNADKFVSFSAIRRVDKFEFVGISVKRKVENGKRMNCVAIIGIISVADP